jgi:hypothetical protein
MILSTIMILYLPEQKRITAYIVPERKLSFSPISVSDSNFNPRNTQCMSVLKFSSSLILTKNPGFRSATIEKKAPASVKGTGAD